MHTYLLFEKLHTRDRFHLTALYRNPLLAERALCASTAPDKRIYGDYELDVSSSIFDEYFQYLDDYATAAAKGYASLNIFMEKPSPSLLTYDALLALRVNEEAVQCSKCQYIYIPTSDLFLSGGRFAYYGQCMCQQDKS